MLVASLLPCRWDLDWFFPFPTTHCSQYWPLAEHLCLEIPALLQSQLCKIMQLLSAPFWSPYIQASSTSGPLNWLFSLSLPILPWLLHFKPLFRFHLYDVFLWSSYLKLQPSFFSPDLEQQLAYSPPSINVFRMRCLSRSWKPAYFWYVC